ncbi:helix-turn-helix domain-containing protein [Streptomyces sp. NPDC056749]|uniref:helix-turn-helix domain-containing protein n=1 Tax=Streptomyces sp. NPDC056749 TaxID=3345936 RepID=UPI0036B32BA4
MSTSSHPSTGQTPRTGPAIDASRATRLAGAVCDIAEDLVAKTGDLFTQSSSGASPLEQLREAVAIQQLAEQAVAGLVVQQRSLGEPLGELEPLLDLSADRLRKKYPPYVVDQQLGSRIRPTLAVLCSSQSAKSAATKTSSVRHPHQRLACALTFMWKRSGITQRALAEHMNTDRSYVSRMLSGERRATLQHVKLIAEKCGGDTDLVVLLWEIAAGVQSTSTDPAHTLRTYLRALRYAAGSPDDEQILVSTQHTITATELQRAFNGPGVPKREVVRQLATALQSLPETVLPLWNRAQSSLQAGTSSYPAAAFG